MIDLIIGLYSNVPHSSRVVVMMCAAAFRPCDKVSRFYEGCDCASASMIDGGGEISNALHVQFCTLARAVWIFAITVSTTLVRAISNPLAIVIRRGRAKRDFTSSLPWHVHSYPPSIPTMP